MATFNGFDLGIVEEFATPYEPNGWQYNAYPGVNGVEALNLGTRGKLSHFRGFFTAANPAALATLHETLKGYQSAGGLATLVDPNGTTWAGVVLRRYRETGPRLNLAGGDGVLQRYEAEFFHNA